MASSAPEVSRIVLPEPPRPRASGEVIAWEHPVSIDTYLPAEPDRYPEFLDKRVYQGSSGQVYPLPFGDRISTQKMPHQWRGVHMENEWLRLLILPEIGGRIAIAYDKVAQYDLFYRNNVIKPALVGLAGPWVSGGVEFNWPQHHRPATFLPTDVHLEHEADGAVTVWCSDHDPFARMKGMHGIRLTPESSKIEARVRLYNRNELPQTFLWWANVAAAVNDDYQCFFPRDVRWVADHAKRAVVAFPKADRPYYSVDYPALVDKAHPDADRLDWYRNIPVPTSYMVTESTQEFFGGYDHGRSAGFVHWAPREISPGKKMWTWGDAAFGSTWNRNLTDTDGPYIELMAGVYTDNQPDFAYLAPGETKTFSQYWYPLSAIGPAQCATADLAGRLDVVAGSARIGLIASERFDALELALVARDGTRRVVGNGPMTPATPQVLEVSDVDAGTVLEVSSAGKVVLVISDEPDVPGQPVDPRTPDVHSAAERGVPAAAVEPAMPSQIQTIDELVHVARYLDQYRHATRSSEPYWQEVLQRDPGESRARTSLSLLEYSRADYETAWEHARAALVRISAWTPTPFSGQTHLIAGLCLVRLGRDAEAAPLLARAAWDASHATGARFALAQLQSRAQDSERAIATLHSLLAVDGQHTQGADLLAALLIDRGDHQDADRVLARTLEMDPLDAWALWLSGERPTSDATIALDVALELCAAGLWAAALDALDEAGRRNDHRPSGQVNVGPLVCYHRGRALEAAGQDDEALTAWRDAERVGARNCLPSRLDDVDALTQALARRPHDGRAHALLGHWLYAHHRRHDAVASWRSALEQQMVSDEVALVCRNLAIAAYNLEGDPDAAAAFYERALACRPADAKLIYESDQLAARRGATPASRIAALQGDLGLVAQRDDLLVAYLGALCDEGRFEQARGHIVGRPFQPWEGGEGLTLAVWTRICCGLARRALDADETTAAATHLDAAADPPSTLGEARHPLANISEIDLLRGDVAAAEDHAAEAHRRWESAAVSVADFTQMAVTPFSEQTLHAMSALDRLGRTDEAELLGRQIQTWLAERSTTPATTDFFATSLPTMLLFVDDPEVERHREIAHLQERLDGWSRNRTAAHETRVTTATGTDHPR